MEPTAQEVVCSFLTNILGLLENLLPEFDGLWSAIGTRLDELCE